MNLSSQSLLAARAAFCVARIVVTTIAAVVAFPACSSRILNREISGQVFIVRRDGESVKLPLVEVRIYDANELAKQLHSISDSLAKERVAAEKLDQQTAKAKEGIKQAAAQLKSAAQAVGSSNGGSGLGALANEVEDLGIIQLVSLEADVERYRNYVESAAPVFPLITRQPLATAKTDADGNFRAAVPRGHNLAIVARAERYVGDTVENYFWTVNLAGETVILSNDNEVSARSKSSLLHCNALANPIISSQLKRSDLEANFKAIAEKATVLSSRAAESFRMKPNARVIRLPITPAANIIRNRQPN